MAHRFLAAVISRTIASALVVALAACAGSGFLTWEPETDAERRLRVQAEALQSTVGEGSLSGAFLGALLGIATGNPGAAFAGARFGQLAGAAGGLYLKSLQEDYADREAQIAQINTDLQETIDETEAALATMRTVLTEQQAQLAALEAAVGRNEAEAAQLDRQKERASRNLAEMRRAIEGAQARQAIFTETRQLLGEDAAAASPGAAQTDTYLATLTNRIAAMTDIAETLANDI